MTSSTVAMLAVAFLVYKAISLFARALRLVISLAIGLGGSIAFHHLTGWLGH
jgi:hypothetical protein